MYIGIDLGGTNIAGGLVDQNGVLLQQYSIPTEVNLGYEKVVENMATVCHKLMESIEKGTVLKGIGIGVPGLADDHSGIVYECVNLLWKTPHNLREDLERYIQVPVHISNDASVAAVAEFKLGALKNVRNGVLFTLGTGVGGGFIVDGKPFSGSHGVGSEIGHMVVGVADYPCNCGRMGCLETFSSATAVIKYAQKLLANGQRSPWLDAHGVSADQIEAKHVLDGAKYNDPICKEAFDRLVHYLAVGIINSVVFIDPEVIAIGGGVAKAGEFLMDALKLELEQHRIFKAAPSFELRFAQMGNDAGIVGAAMLCI